MILFVVMERRLQWLVLLSLLGQAICFVSKLPETYDTIVVGLGSAGVTAASTLAKAGKKVLALEAQDRIGGRVNTVQFGDGVVEVGAEWIHGTEHSRVYETAISNNISVTAQPDSFDVFKSGGRPANKELIGELLAFCLDVQDYPPEKPEQLGNFITRKLKDYLKEKHPKVLEDQDFVDEFLELMNFIINTYEASNDWNDVSAKSNFDELEGSQVMSWHRHGYKTFFELLLNTYKNGPGWPTLEIKLKKEVTTIKWPKDSTGNVEVVCKDGTVYTAKNVIVTVSLGVLKERHTSLFSPAIPVEKATAIEKLSIGVVAKIIMSFPEPWWNTTAILFLWSAADHEEYKDEPWLIKIKDISFPMGSSNTVTFWATGDTAKLIETLPEDVVRSKAMTILRNFLANRVEIPEPTGMIRSSWFSNPFTRGSYTYDSFLARDYPNARAVLGEPLIDAAGNPRVLFAGEATDLTHFSTVHGASDSGHREAMRLLDNDEKKQ